jgi:exodeoxyribonuclease VII small subunit
MPRKEQNSIATFETDFERLATLVDKLEQGNVPLADMLKLYEESMALSAKLKQTLDEAELRIEKLTGVHEELTAPAANDLDDSEDLF